MLHKILPAIALVAIMAPQAGIAKDLKIGFVNAAELIQQSPQAKDATERLKKEFEPRQEALLAKGEKLMADQEKFQKDAALMSAEQRQRKERELINLQRELKLQDTALKEDFTIRRNEEMAKVQDSLRVTIQTIGKSEGFDLILYEGVSYASEQVDITDLVIKNLK